MAYKINGTTLGFRAASVTSSTHTQTGSGEFTSHDATKLQISGGKLRVAITRTLYNCDDLGVDLNCNCDCNCACDCNCRC